MTAHLYASDPNRKPRPQAVPCPACGLTTRNCERTRWLRGQRCCLDCGHPKEETP